MSAIAKHKNSLALLKPLVEIIFDYPDFLDKFPFNIGLGEFPSINWRSAYFDDRLSFIRLDREVRSMIFGHYAVHVPSIDSKKRVIYRGARPPIAQTTRELHYKIDWPNDDVARMHLFALDCGVSATSFVVFAEKWLSDLISICLKQHGHAREFWGRIGKMTSDFEEIPSEALVNAEIVDRRTGAVICSDGTKIFSVRIAPLATIDDEKRLRTEIIQYAAALIASREWSKEIIFIELGKKYPHYHITHRDFSNNIWGKAREAAGLSPKGTPGRPRKNQNGN